GAVRHGTVPKTLLYLGAGARPVSHPIFIVPGSMTAARAKLFESCQKFLGKRLPHSKPSTALRRHKPLSRGVICEFAMAVMIRGGVCVEHRLAAMGGGVRASPVENYAQPDNLGTVVSLPGARNPAMAPVAATAEERTPRDNPRGHRLPVVDVVRPGNSICLLDRDAQSVARRSDRATQPRRGTGHNSNVRR